MASDAAAAQDALCRLGVSHLIGLPDNGTAALFDRLAEPHARPSLVRVTREGEAFAIAAGLSVGGAHPVVVIQNTGLLESGDALRGTVQRMGLPLLCLIGYRGYAKTLARRRRAPPRTRRHLVSSRIDSAALLTEPTLRAWGIPYRFPGDDLPADIAAAHHAAQRACRPVALLLIDAFT